MSALQNTSPNTSHNSEKEAKFHYIFGYGSLIWKQNFSFVSKQYSYIEGFSRRFLQRSADHRGTLWSPGRVCNLKVEKGENKKKKCWGMVFKLSQEQYDDIIDQLDHREKGGYEKHYVNVWDEKDNIITNRGLLYFGQGLETIRENESLEKTAAIIAYGHGPSGPNTEYLYHLVNFLREKGFDESGPDSYLFKLERLTKKYEQSQLPYVSPSLDKERVRFTLEQMKVCFDKQVGSSVIYLSKKRVKTLLRVQSKHRQPSNILHGGLNVFLGETACSVGAFLNCRDGEYAVGQEINCNHIKAIPADQDISVVCIAMPIHIGNRSHVWEFRIVKQGSGEVCAIGRMTASIIRGGKL